MKPTGRGAVMAQRREPTDSLDFFPTPPWATRAFLEHVLPRVEHREPWQLSVWEPAAGAGHMADVLAERVRWVCATDIHDYGRGYPTGDFTGGALNRAALPSHLERPTGKRIDWIITNPPFNAAVDFAMRGLEEAARGVALLVRTAWLESESRYEGLFRPHPPALVAIYSERVPMVRGRWDPAASTATSYAWVVWRRGMPPPGTRLMWIPPGRKAALTHTDDVARFAGERAP